MAAVILDGKKTAEKIKAGLKSKVESLKKKGVTPGLAAILVGNNPSSQLYVKLKQQACDEAGIYSVKHELPEDSSEADLIKLIGKLNSDERIHGILVQMPLPKHISVKNVVKAIKPGKDVDGFNPFNNGAVMDGEEFLVSATPKGVIRLLEEYGIGLESKEVVVVNHTIVLGRPLSMLLMNRNATVIVCNHKTLDLKKHTLQADVIISGAGVPGLIKKDMVQEGCVVVDAGISFVEGKVVGDVDFEKVREKASYITPVPGGVGPMTIAMLLENTILAAAK
ncbi:MAG: bifunctional 5,10-methylenetetrahydrofolate dehydrogenase/5,10-methenyltetrahydrofolate cyclohydrolase [Candidatus Altiarchaeota archaeon]|nr:bifunctional 5,10-methylenetetrahydrofolate dehydrogenase/5,10-methenyltetrahydrofolate cyclohydrolase [Candidatus Altiarchaeota archaeon]